MLTWKSLNVITLKSLCDQQTLNINRGIFLICSSIALFKSDHNKWHITREHSIYLSIQNKALHPCYVAAIQKLIIMNFCTILLLYESINLAITNLPKIFEVQFWLEIYLYRYLYCRWPVVFNPFLERTLKYFRYTGWETSWECCRSVVINCRGTLGCLEKL